MLAQCIAKTPCSFLPSPGLSNPKESQFIHDRESAPQSLMPSNVEAQFFDESAPNVLKQELTWEKKELDRLRNLALSDQHFLAN